MTEAEWLVADSTARAHWLGRFPERQRLLFICACAGLVNPLFPEECPDAIDFVTEFADGVRTREDFEALRLTNLTPNRHPLTTIRYARSWTEDPVGELAARAVSSVARDHAYFRTREMLFESNWREVREQVQREVKAHLWLLHLCIFNPFRPVVFSPTWRTEHTVGIASKMYDDRDFAAMPILADALEEAGCDNADVLAHCREPGPHARGCWVVDGVLGKR